MALFEDVYKRQEYAECLSEWSGYEFRIVGYCMGGLIATEIARNLMERGEVVSDLFVISSRCV